MRRTQYLIHLTPEKEMLNSLCSLKSTLSDRKILERNSALNLHTTVLGFYSECSKLGFDSRDDLESEIVETFKRLTFDASYVLVKNINVYSSKTSKLVLELNSPELVTLQYDTIHSFESLMVLKGNILPSEDREYFLQRYKFYFENYSPHISLCTINSPNKAIRYATPFIGKGFYFDKILLSRKATNTWKDLCVLPIS